MGKKEEGNLTILIKNKKYVLLLTLALVGVMFFCGTVSAGTPLGENQTGTVSGDLYVNVTSPYPSTSATQNNTLPYYTSIDSAYVYINVYSGSGQNNWPLNLTTKIDANGDGDYDDPGELLGEEELNIPGNIGGTVYWKNDHVMRVYSDYQVWYDVTSLITCNNPSIYVQSECIDPDKYDGRLKMIALVVAYNDGDTDQVDYWVLNGQDWIDYGGKSSTTTFNTTRVEPGFTNATLKTVALSSNDGNYRFKGNMLIEGTRNSEGFKMEWTRDVTSYLNAATTSTLTHISSSGSSLKLNLATLTVRKPTMDLVLSQLNVPGTVHINQPCTVNVTVSNQGTSTLGSFTVRLYDNGQEVESKTINALNGYQDLLLTFNWMPTTLGSHFLQVVADLENLIVESNENNNQINQTVIATLLPTPDLSLSNLTLPSLIYAGDEQQVNVTVSNTGTGDASSFTVQLKDEGTVLAQEIVNHLNHGADLLVTLTWTPLTAGLQNLKVVVDALNEVTESDEANNELTKLLTVELKKADLIINNLTIPTDPEVYHNYQLNATITNMGLADSGTFVVELYDGSTLVESQNISNLIKETTKTLQFNWKPISTGNHDLKLLLDTTNHVNESNETNNQLNRYLVINQQNVINIFMISDAPGTNVLNMAAHDILNEYQGIISIQLRNSAQVEAMSEDEIRAYLAACDIFIGEWITTDAATLLSKILSNYPEVANKQNGVFLILEAPVSTESSSVTLMKYSTINGVRILENFTNTELLDYYEHTKRGGNYTACADYMGSVNFPENYNTATLYKNLNDKDGLKNQILWALNLMGMTIDYELPGFSSLKQDYGIYRYRWYTMEEYRATYFESGRQGTVGLIESTMYIDSQMLQTYYALIESLEAQGLNVIPVTAYGATNTQLEVMVRAFTSAPDYASFIADPSHYEIYVDSIVEMVAYGLGGDAFTEVVNFLSLLNVPVVRAIHSDVVSNEEWELETTGLPTDDGSKWWHIAILEAQGIIEYTFVGGKSSEIDPDTGAAILGYDPQEDNIEFMTKRVASWVKLQYMDNADKLIALIYYNYPPGKDNIGSSYLDTITSLYNLLTILKDNNYTVENIPDSADNLLTLIIGDEENDIPPLGINVASWAPGVLESMLDNPNLILYPVSDYMEWFYQLDELTQLQVTEGPVAYIGELCKRAVELNYTSIMNSRIDTWYAGVVALLPDEQYSLAVPILDNIVTSLKNYLLSYNTADYNTYITYKEQFQALNIAGMNGWGEAPGDIMVVEKDGVQYFVIPGLKFGNIYIGPEPQRGWEGDINLLYHSSTVAPPHQYLAYYAWLQEQGTDSMVFMGRHATHEWLPGKELVLSSYDFPSVMAGSVPQIYFYIADGLAEGLQAKRRGFAVIIDHLTPPMSFTQLYGGLSLIADLADQYEDIIDPIQKQDLANQIRETITTNNLETDIGLSLDQVTDDELVNIVNSYLSDVQTTLYPYGLHAIGESWSDDEIALLVTSMLGFEFEISDSGETTTLHEEISQILNAKSYDDLSATKKDEVQNKCIDVVKALIYFDVDTVAAILTSNPSEGLKIALSLARNYTTAINQSFENEVTSFLDALNGGYIEPGAGGDPVTNPDVLPTGTNFYDDQASEIPTKDAFEYAEVLTLLALADITDDTEKIAMGIWCVETARDDGSLVSLVLYLLGMKPDWSDSPSAGKNGQKLKEMPVYVELDDLLRPDGWDKKRIDVTIITSGLFRDLYSRQAQLLDNAFRVALARSYYTIINNPTLQAKYGNNLNTALNTIMEGIGYYGAGSESLSDNYVAKHWVEDFEYYMSLNMTAEVAGEMAITRIFAPPEGDYGAGISKLVSMSWTWEDSAELAEFYINRMGNMYSHNNWGTSSSVVFSRALSGISTVFTSRNSNVYGVLDNDDFFDYWGGLSMAVGYVNGKAPNMYVLSYADRAHPDSVSLEQYMSREMTTRYFNPEWIEGMMNEGYSGARYMSKKFVNNLLGWQMTRPGSVKNWMWDKVVDVYLRDSYNIGVTEFLSSGNNAYSMISLTGTLLTAAYEGYWTTDAATLSLVANTWAQMIVQNGVACCDCSCGNLAMMKWATTHVNADLLAHLNAQLYEATQQSQFSPGQTPQSNPTGSAQAASPSSAQSSSQSSSQSTGSDGGSVGDEESESTTTPGEEGEGKTYEVSKESSGGVSESGLPIAAIIGVIALVCLVGFGYFRGNLKGK